MEPTWFDEVEAGTRGVGDHVRGGDFTPTELAEIRSALNSYPRRELVISAHRSSNAAKVARKRRAGAARWSTPGLRLRTRKVSRHDDMTVVTAVWHPTVAGSAVDHVDVNTDADGSAVEPRRVDPERHEAVA